VSYDRIATQKDKQFRGCILNHGSIKDINVKVDKENVTDLFNSLRSTRINQQQK